MRCDGQPGLRWLLFDGCEASARLTRLLHCSDAGINKGFEILGNALANGSAEG